MIFPIAWHEECLKNNQETHERDRQGIAAEMDRLDKRLREILIYQQQIKQAKEEGKANFDRDRFLVPRKRK